MITKLTLLALTLTANLGQATPTSIVNAPSSPQSTVIVAFKDATPAVIETREVWVTAYSSTPDQTDDTPFITASGSEVRDGVMATNLLPFGTKVKIPSIFGDKIFTVEDRMHPRKVNYVDVWVPTRNEALRIGINYTKIQVLD